MVEREVNPFLVGRPYPDGTEKFPPRDEYRFRDGRHLLTLFRESVPAGAVETMRTSSFEFAIFVGRQLSWFLFRPDSDKNAEWSGGPFSTHFFPERRQMLPPIGAPSRKEQTLQLLLVELPLGTIHVNRAVLLPLEFLSFLHAEIRCQARRAWDPAAAHREIEHTGREFPTHDDLAKHANFRCSGVK
jgi:hypothetical protein